MTGTDSDRTVQAAFARLTRERSLTDLDRQIMNGFERLMVGRPEISDGTVTVTNICVEAGVSRASYYRSPVAAVVKELLAAPAVARPEVEELKAEISRLKKAERKLRSEKAADIRELTDTVSTYADHIQVLTMRNAQLEEENQRYRKRLERAADNVTSLNGVPVAMAENPTDIALTCGDSISGQVGRGWRPIPVRIGCEFDASGAELRGACGEGSSARVNPGGMDVQAGFGSNMAG
ncbi:hypothetical protein [Nonomuraea sp. LPB2021202275-12-8]|uniref:hypothetical protein n=1 Tax=Nonomuraea sp. LPB2021202275-12-8 TaxID=3120159 RepID=UPI00300BFFE3